MCGCGDGEIPWNLTPGSRGPPRSHNVAAGVGLALCGCRRQVEIHKARSPDKEGLAWSIACRFSVGGSRGREPPVAARQQSRSRRSRPGRHHPSSAHHHLRETPRALIIGVIVPLPARPSYCQRSAGVADNANDGPPAHRLRSHPLRLLADPIHSLGSL